jgi:catecholate siderophore receptor
VELNLGVRWDYFKADYRAIRFSTTTPGLVTGTDDITRIDRMPSYRTALVYKPAPNGSVYVDYGTSFNPSAESLSFIVNARAFGISNAFLAPEENKTIELGTKWNVLNDEVAVTAALFRLEKDNARVPDPTNPGFNTLEGTQRVEGFSVNVVGQLSENWKLMAGYAYLDSKVVKSAPARRHRERRSSTRRSTRSASSPNTAFFPHFEIGAGGQYASSRLAQNVPPVKKVPSYWTFDVMAKYDLTEQMSLQLNVNNVFDKYYYEQLHPFHVVPGQGRVALLTLNFDF